MCISANKPKVDKTITETIELFNNKNNENELKKKLCIILYDDEINGKEKVFLYMCKYGELFNLKREIKEWIDSDIIDVNALNDYEYTPLKNAVKTDDYGCTPLMLAVKNADRYSSPKIVKTLIKGGVNLNIKRRGDGNTALMFAIIHLEGKLRAIICMMLYRGGADVKIRNNNYETIADVHEGLKYKKKCEYERENLTINMARKNNSTPYGIPYLEAYGNMQ